MDSFIFKWSSRQHRHEHRVHHGFQKESGVQHVSISFTLISFLPQKYYQIITVIHTPLVVIHSFLLSISSFSDCFRFWTTQLIHTDRNQSRDTKHSFREYQILYEYILFNMASTPFYIFIFLLLIHRVHGLWASNSMSDGDLERKSDTFSF